MLDIKSNELLRNIQIEPTNFCNLVCYMCPGRDMVRKKGLMSMETYTEIINQIKEKTTLDERKTIRLALAGQGEPLVNKNIYDMVKLSKKNGFTVEITTNAVLLNDDNIKKLIDAEIDIICISWYAFDEETYETIYGRGGLKRFVNNIFKLFHYVNKNKSNTIISLTWLASKRNENDNDFASWLFNRMPVARTKGHRVRNYRQLFQAIGIEEKDVVMEKLEEHKKKYPKDNLIGLGCIWNMMYIHWNGNAYPCIADYNGDYLLGNVDAENILDIWNNSRMQNFRKCVIEGKDFEKGKYCNYCTAATPKSIAEEKRRTYKYSYRNINEFNKDNLNFKYEKFCELFPEDKSEQWLENIWRLKKEWTEINAKELNQLNVAIKECFDYAADFNAKLKLIGENAECIQLMEYISENFQDYDLDIDIVDKYNYSNNCSQKHDIFLICDYNNHKQIFDNLTKNLNIENDNIFNLYKEKKYSYFYKHYHDDFNIVGQYKYVYSL